MENRVWSRPRVPAWLRRRIGVDARRDLAALGFLALLWLAFFWPVLNFDPANPWHVVEGDFSAHFWPFRAYTARLLAEGQLPLWNPYTFAGLPHLADVEAAVFYPPALLTALLGGPSLSLDLLELEACAHYLLSACLAYGLGRRWFAARLPALVLAVGYTFGGFLTSYPLQQLSILEVYAWLPLLLWLLDVAVERGLATWRRIAWFALPGAALALPVLAGHTQSLLHVVYLCLAYAAFAAWQSRPERGRAAIALLPRFAAALTIFLATGLGLSAIQLAPSVELFLLSARSTSDYARLAGGFFPTYLISVLLPHVLGGLFSQPLYAGILPLFLVAVALARPQRARTLFWALVALIALVSSWGGATFVFGLYYRFLPGFALFRGQERLAGLYSFAIAVLAAQGLAALLEDAPSLLGKVARWMRRVAAWLLVAAVVGVIGAAAAQTLESASQQDVARWLGEYWFAVVMAGLSATLLYMRGRGLFSGPRFGILAAGLLSLDLLLANGSVNFVPADPAAAYRVAPAILDRLAADPGLFRVHNDRYIPNYGMVSGLYDTSGRSELRLARYSLFFSSLPERRLWQLLNVKYVVTWRPQVEGARLLQEDAAAQFYLHEVENSAPRAYVAYSVSRDLDRLAAPDFDPLREVVLEAPVDVPFYPDVPGSSAEVLTYEPQRVVVHADTPRPGILVLADAAYPGWKAKVDGQLVLVHTADYLLRAVALPAGSHTVEFYFEPGSARLGLAVSTTTALLLLLLAGGFRLRRAPR